MSCAYSDLASTPTVRAMQIRMGSRSAYDGADLGRAARRHLGGACTVASAVRGKELFVVATYAVVPFSLPVQAPTLGPLLKT